MELLITLIILLVLAIVFFVTYPIIKRKIVAKKYNDFCSRKIKAIASKNGLKYLTNLKLSFFNQNELGIDHILFGKKYFYILSNYYYDGYIKGTAKDNSWIYTKRRSNETEYIDNISEQLSEKTGVFSSKITANPELIVPIAILNNECEIRVSGINKNNTFVVHYSSLKKLIKNLESRNIENLDLKQIKNKYEILREENEQK